MQKDRSLLCESKAEELANAITHGLGVIMGIVALVFMLILSNGDPWKVVAASIFGSTIILLYLSSTLYHSFSNPKVKNLFQIFDHSAIYLLIAGSYTPLSLVTIRGAWGWSLFGTVWGLAIAGIVTKAVMHHQREHWISTAFYVFMGWLIVIAGKPLWDALDTKALVLFVIGGLCYSLGVIFFAWRRLKFNHAIWHLFVLAGTTCHAICYAIYVFAKP